MPRPPSLRVLLLCLLSIAASPALAQNPGNGPPARKPFAKPGTAPREERVRTFDVRHLKAELTIDTKKSAIRGTVTQTIVPLHPGFKTVTLDCGADLKVSEVTAGSAACEFKHKEKENSLEITLDRAYAQGETITLAVTYAGEPDVGMHFVKPDADHPDRKVSVWTQGEPEEAHFWLPCYDYPNERFTAELIVTVNQPLSVVSNGVLVSTHDNPDGTATFDWKMDQQLPAYLLSVTAADFAVYHDKVGDLPVDYYVLKEVDEATARRAMGKTPKMIQFFNDKIGTPYAFAKYAQVCLPEFGGGMEHSSATTMTDTILTDPIAHAERDADSIVAHELAHQWFGDLLTCRDWSNLWLNEGFASYFDPLFTEFDRGPDAFALALEADKGTYLGSDRGYRRPIVEAKYNDPNQMFDGVTYSKGACVLHMLRGLVGDDAWWRGIKLYVARNRDHVVETADFRSAMEEASGQDLHWFFDQWVFHGGHPELTASWRYEEADKTLRLKVEQTQPVDDLTPLFRLPTTVEFGDESGVRSVPIVIDAKTQEFIIPTPTRPKLVRIDPQGWLLKVLTFEKPTDELIYQLDHAGNALGRVEAARGLATSHKDEKLAAAALARAWSREQTPEVRAAMVQQLARVGEPVRGALLEAAKDPEFRVRNQAMVDLKFDPELESFYRAIWADKSAPYNARRAALRGLIAAEVKDADALIATALQDPTNRYSFAVVALDAILKKDGRKSHEAAVLYSRPGQPSALRRQAIRPLARQAKDDPQSEKLLMDLLDDPSESIQTAAGLAITSEGIAKAIPKLEQMLAHFQGSTRIRQRLESQLEDLKKKQEPATPAPATAAASTKEATDLDRQAADLELQAKELRNRAEAVRIKAEKAKQAASARPAA